ncbi:putative helix-loop-helix dna binding protein [Neofusicoccum parvum UCRNP2]|uniref:Putative helix-loop-helix dna binding protein n=1 Tax=Botryosphaeria parva (strain UCR-NP2) TaxID=1287680 RepID=R1GMK1_BOTPV|nr:putative helix-loop-helix dna binding protein [Neofusicoccum parvum UCRNP2]
MTDVATYPETEAKPEVADTTTMNNKRKRSSLDQGPTSGRPAPGDATRNSTFQRVSPGSANNAGGAANSLNDQSGNAFLTGHHTTGTGEDDIHHHTNADLDFSQLAQHTNDHSLHQNGGGNPTNASDTAAAALSHHFQMTASHGMTDYGLDALNKSNSQAAQGSDSPPTQGNQKPAVGSEEWHKIRRDNHKEVERRRRETINEGINELAKIVPGCEKNKGSILQRAVQFITQLKENESQNIEKWTLEKLLTEQAITELSASCDKFKADCQRAWAEAEVWKKACQNAGIVPEEFQNQGDKVDQNGDS